MKALHLWSTVPWEGFFLKRRLHTKKKKKFTTHPFLQENIDIQIYSHIITVYKYIPAPSKVGANKNPFLKQPHALYLFKDPWFRYHLLRAVAESRAMFVYRRVSKNDRLLEKIL